MALRGIDIASYQTGIDLTRVPCDFVIVKATQGTRYVNPDFTRAIQQAIGAGKLVGCYHYASSGGAENEAEHFLTTVKPYIGRAILVLDWEQGSNANYPNEAYAKRFMDYVRSKVGVSCFFYDAKYFIQQHRFGSIAAAGYPLWAAQYKNYQPTGYQAEPWTDKRGWGGWTGCLIYQYSSNGVLDGWGGRLDINIAYMSAAQWKRWASNLSGGTLVPEKPVNGQKKIDTTGYPVTRYGHRNEWVRLLQNALTIRGFPCQPDGIFMGETSRMVRAFQESRKLEIDGVVGPQTWAALFGP